MKDFNFLGITIEEHLNWKLHIDKISKKISRAIGIMNKLKQQLPTFILKILYDSLIQCHINYGILAWGFNTTNIFKLQKKSIRVITKVKYNAHTDPLFKNHDILKAQDIFKLNILKFFLPHVTYAIIALNLLFTVCQINVFSLSLLNGPLCFALRK